MSVTAQPFGKCFEFSELYGSEANDAFSVNDGKETVITSKLNQECNLEFELDHENKCVSQFNGITTKINKIIP